MELLLSKALAQLAYPLSTSLLLCCLAVVAVWRKRYRSGQVLLLLAIAYLLPFATPPVSNALRLSLESRYPYAAADALPDADAIVVLGSGTGSAAPPAFPYLNVNNAADRILHAARLYHAGKAPLIITSGGGLPWRARRFSEADTMTQLLISLGVPSSAVLQESASATTRENALFTEQLLRQKDLQTVLLVTSALHMPRAAATFRALGVTFTPAATDFEIRNPDASALRWLPSAGALEGSTRALKEYLGLAVYRWRGWAR